MATWQDRNPARPSALPHLPLERLKAGKKICGAITCLTPYDQHVHYLGGRTLPCAPENCPGCTAERRRGWELYVSLWTPKPSRHILTALTPAAALNLSDQVADPSNIRGWWLEIERVNVRANAKMIARVIAPDDRPMNLPPAPNLKAHMYKIWGLNPDEINAEHPLFAVREQFTLPEPSTNGARLGQME